MTMFTAVIIVSLVCLVLSLVVYRRYAHADSGDAAARLSLRALSAKPKELVQSATHSLAAAYDHTRRRLTSIGKMLRDVRTTGVAGLEERAAVALRHLRELSAALEKNARAAHTHTVASARRMQNAIITRTDQLEARALLLLASWKARRARSMVIEQRFATAEELLEDSAHLIRRAEQALKSHPEYQLTLDEVRRGTREAAASVRTHAALTERRMERLLADTDRLVNELERSEGRFSGSVPTPSAAVGSVPELANSGRSPAAL